MIRLIALDTETTGTDVYADRIVTCYLGLVESDGSVSVERNWIVDPGIEVPDEAAQIHGFTTARVRAEGRKDIPAVLGEIFNIIQLECGANGTPLCGFNLSFDLTLLESERRRHAPELPPLDFDRISVMDGLILDKHVDKFRRGSRKLIDTARFYRVPITEAEAHSASFDAVASARIVQTLLRKRAFAGLTPRQLHAKQIGWKRDQAASFESYLRTKANPRQPDAVIDGGWPLQTQSEGATA